MGVIVVAVYRPKRKQAEKLLELVKAHGPCVKEQGLASDRPRLVMRAEDGTIIEIFEWKDEAAAGAAHSNEAVQKIWSAMGDAADFIPLAEVPGADMLFSHFEPLDLD